MRKLLVLAAFLAPLQAASAQPIPSLWDTLEGISDVEIAQYYDRDYRRRSQPERNTSSGYMPEDTRLQPGNRYRPEDSRLETPRQQRSNEFIQQGQPRDRSPAGYCFNGKCY